MRGPVFPNAMRTLAAWALAAAVLLPATRAFAGASDPRTLVVRGRVLAADGTPVTGARVSARGSANTSAMTDDRGRYTLSLPMGSAAGLRRGAFTLEVRAEAGGKRLALGSGGSALGLDVALTPAGRVRVRSNAPSATSAIATAFAQDGGSTAWVDADFGGAGHAGGTMTLNAVDEVSLDGREVPAPRESARVQPPPRKPRVDAMLRPAPAPAPTPATPAPRPAPVAERAAAPVAAAHESLHVKRKPRRERPQPVAPPAFVESAPSRESLATRAQAPRPHVAPAPAPAPSPSPEQLARAAAAARRDSVARAERIAWLEARAERARIARAARDSVRAAKAARALAAHAPRVAVVVTPPPASDTLPARVPAPPPPTTRVVNVPERDQPDTCACRLRGTVEIDWERPLERNFPVELVLEGPATQRGEVDMFIGSPREFRFGPLPCGEYRLLVRAEGRLHYALERGDSLVRVSCHGLTQSRVVLVPAKR